MEGGILNLRVREWWCMPPSSNQSEPVAAAVIGVVVIALLIIGLGFWFWKSTSYAADYSELFWDSAPRVGELNNANETSISFTIRLRSHELQDFRWDVNAYARGELIDRKKIQLEQGQEKRVSFTSLLSSAAGPIEIRIVAQRFDGFGNPIKMPLEISDWVIVSSGAAN